LVAQKIRDKYGLSEDDVRSTPLGVSGTDVQLSEKAQKHFPFSVECKARESLGRWPWDILEQQGKRTIGVIKRNRRQALVLLTLEDFFNIIK